MKRSYLTVFSLLVALLFLGTTATYATESIVFLDDDPGNTTSTTSYVGTWTTSSFVPQSYGPTYRFTRDAGFAAMRTTIDIDESGGGVSSNLGSEFQAFARWVAGNNRCNSVRIEVRNATTNTLITFSTVSMTLQSQSLNWNPIGARFTAVPNQLYEIRVIAPGICVTTVDGGMFVQQTYNSSDVFNLTRDSIDDEAGIGLDQSGQIASSRLAVCTIAGGSVNWTNLAKVTLTTPQSYGVIWVHANGISAHVNDTTAQVCIAPMGAGCSSWAPILDQSSIEVSEGTWDHETRWVVSDTFPAIGTSQTFYLKGCKGSPTADLRILWDDFVGMYFPTEY